MHGIVNHISENFSSSGFQATWPRPRRSRRAFGCRPGQGAHLAHVPLDETTQGKMLPSRACANRLLTNANLSGPWMVRSNLAYEDAMRAAMTFERDKRMTVDEDFTVQKDAIAGGLSVFLDRIGFSNLGSVSEAAAWRDVPQTTARHQLNTLVALEILARHGRGNAIAPRSAVAARFFFPGLRLSTVGRIHGCVQSGCSATTVSWLRVTRPAPSLAGTRGG